MRLIVNPRGGKVAAQNRAVRETNGEILAFSDANATWAPDALRQLVANFADPDVAYVCGQLVLEAADGSNREGVYWRYEMAQRLAESRLGSITGGNGSIYAVRRSDYVEVDPKWGHDLSFPYRMVQAGRRAVYEPAARAFEKPTPSNETEYRRKVRMFEHCWEITLRGSMLKRLPPGYLVQVISHRVLRYGSGLLHLVLLATSLALVGEGLVYQVVLAGAARCWSRRRARRRDRPLLRARHLGDRRRALELPPPRRARDVGSGRGHPLNRALDVAIAGAGLAIASPVLALAALAVKLGDGGPVLFKQTRVGKDGARLRAAEAADDGRRRGAAGRRLRGRQGRQPDHARRPLPPPHVDRRAAAALERRPRRHEPDRAAADAALPGREVHRSPAPPARGAARDHRLGADPRPRVALLGRADRARRLVRRPPLAAHRPADPAAHAARALRRHLQGGDRGLARSDGTGASRRIVSSRCSRARRHRLLERPHYPPLGFDAIDHIAYAEASARVTASRTGSARTTRRPASTRWPARATELGELTRARRPGAEH